MNVTVWYSCADVEGGRFVFEHTPRESLPRVGDVVTPRAWEPRCFRVVSVERGPAILDWIVRLAEVRERA